MEIWYIDGSKWNLHLWSEEIEMVDSDGETAIVSNGKTKKPIQADRIDDMWNPIPWCAESGRHIPIFNWNDNQDYCECCGKPMKDL